METPKNTFNNWSNEKLWNTIFQKFLVSGATVRIENEDGDLIEQSLPLSRDVIELTELYNYRFRLVYRKKPGGERGEVLLSTPDNRPVISADFSVASFQNNIVKNPNVEPETLEMTTQTIFIERPLNQEKPKVVYHGSSTDNIEIFEPRSAQAGDARTEPPAVYASPDIRIAKQSMANKFVSNGGVVNGRHFVCIPMTEQEFRRVDNGGYIYELPSDTFSENDGLGFGETEWISHKSVTPTSKSYYPSILSELKKIGVEVYFIRPEDISQIMQLQDGNPDILENYLNSLKK